MKTLVLLSILLLAACEQGRTSVGTGGGPVQATNTPVVTNPVPQTSFVPTSVPPPQSCPIFNPVTGALVCSCASLQAGEC